MNKLIAQRTNYNQVNIYSKKIRKYQNFQKNLDI